MMGRNRYLILLLAAFVFAGSCKKDETSTTVSSSMTGQPTFSIPVYVNPGDEFDLKPAAVKTVDAVDYGYFWTINPIQTARDTVRRVGDPEVKDGTYHLVVPDTLCTITVSCSAFAKGHYNATYGKDVTIVSEESLTDNVITVTDGGIFKDDRDGVEYLYAGKDGVEWMCVNAEYAEAGVPLEKCPAAASLFGHYYTWEEAQSACPAGWRLPTVDDWKTVCGGFTGTAGSLMVNARFNDELLWTYWPEVKITNASSLTVLPTGYATVSDGEYAFVGFRTYAAFWTATESDAERAQYVYLNEKTPDVMVGVADKTHFAASVRCIR